MKFLLIPRVKVNYSFFDIIRALLIGGNGSRKEECVKYITEFYNVKNVLLVPSARDAIYELLIRLPQKKVVIPSYTCMVVNEAVELSHKEIVYAKTDANTYNSSYLDYIDEDCIVLATHQYGLPCNIVEIAEKCKKVGAVLIEDCATSLGTVVKGQLTGTFGDYAVISLNASKTITVPPFGGILLGKDKDLLQNIDETAEWRDCNSLFKIKGLMKALAFVIIKNPFIYKLFHWYAIDRKDKLQRSEYAISVDEKTEFYKYRFTEWQAYFLLKQLKKINKIIKKRQYVYSYYDSNVNNTLIKKPILNSDAVCTRYVIQVKGRYYFYKKCLSKGVDMDFSHCHIGAPLSFKEEHELSNTVLNLPFYYNISKREMKKVVEVINSIK